MHGSVSCKSSSAQLPAAEAGGAGQHWGLRSYENLSCRRCCLGCCAEAARSTAGAGVCPVGADKVLASNETEKAQEPHLQMLLFWMLCRLGAQHCWSGKLPCNAGLCSWSWRAPSRRQLARPCSSSCSR